MKVEWLGHACFLITSGTGARIVTDPYKAGAFGLNYKPPAVNADVVTVSHEHEDHNNVSDVKGNPEVVRGTGTKSVKGIDFKGIATYHDDASGSQRGPNTVFVFEVDGLRVCHLGDLGHELSDKTLSDIGPVDVLMVPVGGNFTIDAARATRVADAIGPKIVVPMHCRTERCPNFPVAGMDEFRQKRRRVKESGGSSLEVKKEDLPAETETVVLKPAM